MLDLHIRVTADDRLALEQALTFVVERIHAGSNGGERETHHATTEWAIGAFNPVEPIGTVTFEDEAVKAALDNMEIMLDDEEEN